MQCSLQLRYMQQYQQRMAQIAAQEAAGPQFKRQKSEAGGWQEVGATAGGWEPVTTASEAAGVKPELQLGEAGDRLLLLSSAACQQKRIPSSGLALACLLMVRWNAPLDNADACLWCPRRWGAVHPVQSTAEGGAEDQADDEWEDA